MQAQGTFMDAITTGITAEALWGALVVVAPLIITATLFAFGLQCSANTKRKLVKVEHKKWDSGGSIPLKNYTMIYTYFETVFGKQQHH